MKKGRETSMRRNSKVTGLRRMERRKKRKITMLSFWHLMSRSILTRLL